MKDDQGVEEKRIRDNVNAVKVAADSGNALALKALQTFLLVEIAAQLARINETLAWPDPRLKP